MVARRGSGVGDGQRDEDGADPQTGQRRHDEVDGVGQEERDPISLDDAAGTQSRTDVGPPRRSARA